VRRFVAEGFEGIHRTEVPLAGQFAREQQQQLTQLQGQHAAEQGRPAPGQPVEGQQQLLLQHPLTAVLTAEAADHRRDRQTALGLTDQRIVGVVAAHHHLLLAHQQIGERILQLGVHQAEGAGAAAHHIPVAIRQGAAVDLLQQGPWGGTAARSAQLGIQAQAMHQLLQQFGLLRQ